MTLSAYLPFALESNVNVLLTAIEKAFLKLDPQTKVSEQDAIIKNRHTLFLADEQEGKENYEKNTFYGINHDIALSGKCMWRCR